MRKEKKNRKKDTHTYQINEEDRTGSDAKSQIFFTKCSTAIIAIAMMMVLYDDDDLISCGGRHCNRLPNIKPFLLLLLLLLIFFLLSVASCFKTNITWLPGCIAAIYFAINFFFVVVYSMSDTMTTEHSNSSNNKTLNIYSSYGNKY